MADPISAYGPSVQTLPAGPQPTDTATSTAATSTSTGTVDPYGVDGRGTTVTTGRVNNPTTQARLEQLQQTSTRKDEATKPSFFQTVLEIFDFVIRCIPGIGEIANLLSAIIRTGRLVFDLLSGVKDIDWTKELARIAGDLVGAVPGFSIAGALANATMNYWFDAQSDNRQGAQIMGGVNYYMGDADFGPDRQSSIGYYTRDLFNGVRDMFNGRSAQPAVVSTAATGTYDYDPATGAPRAAATQAAVTTGVDPAATTTVAPATTTTGPQPQGSRQPAAATHFAV